MWKVRVMGANQEQDRFDSLSREELLKEARTLSTRCDDVLKIVDGSFRSLGVGSRELISDNEIADVLIDIRLSIVRPVVEVEEVSEVELQQLTEQAAVPLGSE